MFDAEEMQPICSHRVDNLFNTHLYAVHVGNETLRCMQSASIDATHGHAGGGGCLIVAHATLDSVNNVYHHCALAASVKEELAHLIRHNYLPGSLGPDDA